MTKVFNFVFYIFNINAPMKVFLSITISIVYLFFSGCSLEKQGRTGVDGAIESLANPANKARLDSTIRMLVSTIASTARDTILSPKTKTKLTSLIDALTLQLDVSLNRTFRSLRKNEIDSLLFTLHNFAKNTSEDIIKNLVNEKNSDWVKNLTHNVIHDASLQILATKNGLLDSSTQKRLNIIIDSSMAQVSRSYNKHLKGDLNGVFNRVDKSVDNANEQVSSLQKKITWGLIGGAAIIIALIVLAALFYQRHKQSQKVLGILTTNIHELPNQPLYDQITKKTQEQAQLQHVDGYFNNFLKEKMKTKKENWKEKNNETLQWLAKKLMSSTGDEVRFSKQALISEARQNNLGDYLEKVLNEK